MPSLSGANARQLHEALVSAFDFQGLRQLMAYDLDEVLENVVGSGALDTVVYELIEWADRNGRVEDLIKAAAQNRPRNQQIADVAQALLAPPAAAGAAAATPGAAAYDGPRRARLRAA